MKVGGAGMAADEVAALLPGMARRRGRRGARTSWPREGFLRVFSGRYEVA